jgi:ribosome biogenesis GTPase
LESGFNDLMDLMKREKGHPSTASTLPGTVIASARKRFRVATDTGESFDGAILAKFYDLAVGDRVEFKIQKGEAIITTQLERKNLLRRSYFDKTRTIAANIDHLFVITSVGELFNSCAVDRLMVGATLDGIEISLIINKCDLDLADAQRIASIYERVGISCLITSAKHGAGMDALGQYVRDFQGDIICFSGISGVGKSSLINTLFPLAARTTSDVSEKTGQGRQTTSQTMAYVHLRHGDLAKKVSEDVVKTPLFVVDSPGVQSFGLTHVEVLELRHGFPEFHKFETRCTFNDCLHLAEPGCTIREAVTSGEISQGRYDSYLQILEEIRTPRY